MPYSDAPRSAKTPQKPTTATKTSPAAHHAATDPGLEALRAKADASTAVTQLQQIQSRADQVVQREVDDSPITGSAGGYYATGTLPWDKSGEVTEETEAEFKDPILTLMCSTVDGKIGSIYFEGGRVRTTHKSGPTTSEHEATRTFQYNIDRKAAEAAFVSSGAKKRMVKANRKKPKSERKSIGRLLNSWIAHELKGQRMAAVPDWATPLNSPDDAFDSSAEADASGLKLFEVMLNAEGDISSKHPSRGAAAQIGIRKSDLEKLKGVGQLMKGEKDPRKANELFYEYVRKHLPHLLGAIRKPSDIKY